MDWRNVYQLPLKYNEYCPFWVWSNNNVHAIDILRNLEDNDYKKLVRVLNREEKFNKSHDFCISDDTIFCDNKPLLRVRGWGHLTGIGALNLPVLEAIKIQNDFLNYLLEVLKKS